MPAWRSPMKVRLWLAAALCTLVPAAAFPQALTSLPSVRVQYNTRKNTVKPQGDLKAQIDALDTQIAEASRAGRNGELRRLFAKGLSLLNDRPWTEAAEYAASLVLRTDRVVVDSARPHTIRLEQIFAPSIALQRPVVAPLPLRRRPLAPPRAHPASRRSRRKSPRISARSTAFRATFANRRSRSTPTCTMFRTART